jgi:acetoacetyl-CoA synthetase
MRRFAERNGFSGFDALLRWSITDLEGFWRAVADFYEIGLDAERVLGSRAMPGAEWFPGAMLNYAEHMLRDGDDVAVVGRSQSREPVEWTRSTLREQVRRASAGLRQLGVTQGDRVVAYLPNLPETLAFFLAAASLGAVWASVSPEFGPRSVIDRFAQIEPKVLIAVDGYTHRGRFIDRTEALAEIRRGLATLEHVIGPAIPDAAGDL